MKRSGCTLLPALLLPAMTAYGHHSATMYNHDETLTLEGSIVRYEWANPHVYFWLEAEGENGDKVVWEVENGPPYSLRRAGWTKETLKAGDRVMVRGHPGKDDDRDILLSTGLEKVNGEERASGFKGIGDYFDYLARDSANHPATADGLDGTWDTLIDLKFAAWYYTPSNYPLTEKGKAAVAAYDDRTKNPEAACTTPPAPGIMVGPGMKSLEFRDDVLIIGTEVYPGARTVYLGAASHDGAVPSVTGHSIGHWEGDTLVVDTMSFLPQGGQLPSSAGKHLVETFALTEDRTKLEYGFTLADPEYLAEPVEGKQVWAYRPDLDFEIVPCNAENSRRYRGL